MPDLSNPQTSSQPSKKLTSTTIIIIVIVACVILGSFILCYLPEKKPVGPQQPPEEETPAEEEKITTPTVIYNLAGSIEEIRERIIVFEAVIPQIGEGNQLIPKKETRRVLVGLGTEIYSLNYVLHEETGKKIPKETKLSFEDLKVGDYVEVISSENIRDKEEFGATKIRVLSSSNTK